MAYTDALSIFKANRTDEDALAESYASITDQIQKSALSVALKNAALSGNPLSGSVRVRRLQTSLVKTYGTARTAGEGDKISNNEVTINLDVRKEVVEEVNKFDLEQFGLAGIIGRRAVNFGLSVARHLDYAFFAEAESAGSSVSPTGTTIAEKIESIIQDLEETTNENVDGVDRELMALSLTPEIFAQLESYIDTLPNPVRGGVDVNYFHRVRVYSNTRQTKDAVLMVVGAIAQPMAVIDLAEGDIPLSADRAIQLFFNYGTKAVAPDLVRYADLGGGSI